MKRFCLLVSILFLALSLSAGQGQVVIPLGSSVYRDMDTLYLLEGLGRPSTARPWNIEEATRLLAKADSTAHRPLYEAIEQRLAVKPTVTFDKEFAIGLSATINTELYVHSNGDRFGKESDWVRGFVERKPLVKLDLDLFMGPNFYIHSDLQYGRNRFNALDPHALYTEDIGAIVKKNEGRIVLGNAYLYSKPFLTNILPFTESYDVDFETPKRAFISLGNGPWSVVFGRNRISWGNGKSGNFIIGDHTDFHEFARFKYFSNFFSYDWLNIFLPTNPSPTETEDTSIRIFMAHRLEWNLFNRMTLVLSENVMYASDMFDLRYLNPAFIYHNLNNVSMFNAIAHAELDISIAKGLNAYGQYVLDQAKAPNEPDNKADASGFLVGVEYAHEIKTGVVQASLEFARTTPILYRRADVDFLMFRKYCTHGNPGGPGYLLALDYIGYQHGGDTRLIQFDLGYRLPPSLNGGFRMILIQQGEVDLLTSNEDIESIRAKTPSGDAIKEKMILSLYGTYEYPLSFADLQLWAQLDWVGRRVFTRSEQTYSQHADDLQFTLGVGITF